MIKTSNQEFIENFKKLMDLTLARLEESEHVRESYGQYEPLIKDLRENIGNLLLSHKEFIEDDVNLLIIFDGKYNFKFYSVMKIVTDLVRHGLCSESKLQNLEEQNQAAKHYIHYDYSMKRPKSVGGA